MTGWLRGVAVALLAVSFVHAAEPMQVRAFEVRHRAVGDAFDLVSPLLSPEGSVQIRPGLKTLVVEDRPANLERIRQVLDGFDLAPRNVEVSFTLLLGTDTRSSASPRGMDPASLSREIRGVHENLGDFTKWTDYELLGSQSVTVVEGHAVAARLSAEYRVQFEVESVEAPNARSPAGTIILKSLVLERVTRDAAGAERVDELYSTAMQLHAGKLLTVGAAQSPESRKALFLTIKARPE